MTDEEKQQTDAAPPAKKSPKKLLLYAGVFLVGFLLTAALNYFQLKSSYVPPEKAPSDVVEEKKPVLNINLGRNEAAEDTASAEVRSEELLAEAPPPDTTSPTDSLQQAIRELTAAARMKDSLLQTMRTELDQSKKAAPKQEALPDSIDLKKPVKLAKIVESMPADDAAKMLEPLADDIVIDILLRIKQRQAAKIMAALPSARAARLSDRIMQPIVQR
jgi:flagellar motility protein MotE (MotC chaperone)